MPLRVADYRALAKCFREVVDNLSEHTDKKSYEALKEAASNVACYCKDHNSNFDIRRFMNEANLSQ